MFLVKSVGPFLRQPAALLLPNSDHCRVPRIILRAPELLASPTCVVLVRTPRKYLPTSFSPAVQHHPLIVLKAFVTDQTFPYLFQDTRVSQWANLAPPVSSLRPSWALMRWGRNMNLLSISTLFSLDLGPASPSADLPAGETPKQRRCLCFRYSFQHST